MPVVDLNTLIRAPRERVFDLARSIDAHLADAVVAVDRGSGQVMAGGLPIQALVAMLIGALLGITVL